MTLLRGLADRFLAGLQSCIQRGLTCATLAALLFAGLTPQVLLGQSYYGSLSGIVKDQKAPR